MKNIIGREDDIKALNVFLRSNKSEFLAVYGRRRIGKTFLITNFFTQTDCVFFYVSGIQKYGLEEQIKEFVSRLSQTFYAGATLASYSGPIV